MADPLSIINGAGACLATAKTAWEVGTALYVFIQSAKKIDETLQAFAEEIKSLGAACEVVGNRLEDIHSGSQDHGTQSLFGRADKLWTCLHGQLNSCQRTILALKDAVDIGKVGGGGKGAEGGASLWQKAVKQIILNLRAADIDDARNRVRSHTASLQILLQGMAIELTYLAPHRADQTLQTKLADLSKKNQELTALLAERESTLFDEQANEEAILKESKHIISSGETLYAESQAGGSVLGDHLDPATEGRISNWIQHTNALESIDSGPSSPTTVTTDTDATSSVWTERVANTEDTVSVYSPPNASNSDPFMLEPPAVPGDEDTDSDDDFAIEAAAHALDAGRQAFEVKDYEGTNAMLQEALVMIRELPLSQQKKCDPGDLRYMLAVCTFHLQDTAAAKVALLSVIEHTSSAKVQDDKRRLQICHAGHLLAQVCVKLGELEQARTYCESAMHGRRRLLGKTDESFYESLALMVRILELQGKVERANVFARMIPESQRDLIVGFRGLVSRVPAGDSVQTTEPLERPRTLSVTRKPVGGSSGPSFPRPPPPPQVPLPPKPPLPPQVPLPPKVPSPFRGSPDPRNVVAESMEQLALSPTASSTASKGPMSFQNPHLRQWVHLNGYQPPKSMPPDKKTRKMWRKKFRLADHSKLLKALCEGRDDEALYMARGEKTSFFERRYEAGHPPELHVAVLFGQTDVVAALLKCNVDLSYKSRMGLQPLHCAAAAGYYDIARMLIAAGAPIDDASDVVGTPLCLAVIRRRLDVVDLLLQHGADPLGAGGAIGSPLHLACATNNVALVKAMGIDTRGFAEVRKIEAAALQNIIEDDMPTDRDTSQHTDIELEQPIVEPPIFVRMWSMRVNPFEFAAYRGSGAVIGYMLSRQVYVPGFCVVRSQARRNIEKHNALTLAALGGSATVTATLLRHVSLQSLIPEGDAPDALQLAVVNRYETVANLLLDAGARATVEMVNQAQTMYHMSPKGKAMPNLVARLEKSVHAPANASTSALGVQDAGSGRRASGQSSRSLVVSGRRENEGVDEGMIVENDPPPSYAEVEEGR